MELLSVNFVAELSGECAFTILLLLAVFLYVLQTLYEQCQD